MIEALWSMEFQTSAKGEGTGIVVMKDGKIAGGDNQYFYVGTYKLKDRTVTADVSVTHYAGAPVSVFGFAEALELRLTGEIARDKFETRGSSKGKSIAISVIFQRRAELP